VENAKIYIVIYDTDYVGICKMKRYEAVACLKEINSACRQISPDAVTLINSPANDPLSTGYQVHIHLNIDDETKNQIQTIAQTHQLVTKEEKDKVVIYQPKPVTKTVAVICRQAVE
jgi:hypothetical protein